MNLVNLEAAVKAYGPRVLLDRVSLGVVDGDRIGVVGRNGAGKTTLLAALAGSAELDSGRATHAGSLRIGYLPQRDEATGEVRELVVGGLAEHEWAADARSRGVITALLPGIDLSARAERLSGGERRRVALAALLRGSHDLLLLDEPTNHLDIEAISWLAGYLRDQAQALVVVTHDRWFLDTVSERTWEVGDGQVRSYEGGYSAYVLAKAERARIEQVADARRRSLLRKELAWLRRGPPARTSKPKFRINAATALIADEPAPRDSVELSRLATARLGKTVFDVTDVTVVAGQRLLLDHLTWGLRPGERVGIVGINGSGKTTLLRLLAGTLPAGIPEPGIPEPGIPEPGSARLVGGLEPGGGHPGAVAAAQSALSVANGRVVRGKTVRIGYLAQDAAVIDPQLRALEAAEQVRQSAVLGKREVSASQLLDLFGLRGDRQWTLVGELSGGERRRLQLLMLLMAEPNVLLLDEPTNDLDIETLNEFEDMLDGWPGSIVVVSHDRYFLERVTDHVTALIGGQLADLPGGVAEYLERRQHDQGAAVPAPAGRNPAAAGRTAAAAGRTAAPAGRNPAANGRNAAGEAGAKRGMAGLAGPGRGPAPAGQAVPSAAAQRRTGRKELSRLERQLDVLAGRERDLTASLAANASDYAALIDLGAKLRSLQAEKAAAEERWLVLAQELAD